VKNRANSNWQMAIGASEVQHLPRRHGDTEESRLRQLLSVWELIKAMLREIFDESAYDRFLARTGNERSVASYRAFTRERESSLARKPRCC
jgi:hypothetical protein